MRVCAEPGCPALVTKGRCQQHRTYSPTYHERDWAEQQRRAATVAAWIAEHGHWCPGYGVPPHESHDLTAEHVTAVANGGGKGPLAVLCRVCNSRKGARTVEQVSEKG